MDTSHLTLEITSSQLQQKIKTLGEHITKTYKNDKTIIVGVLNGAFMFVSDLIKEIKIRTLVDFVGTSSYENNKKTDKIIFTKKLKYNIEGLDVILIEDMIDSGRSINFVLEYFFDLKPKSIKIWTILGRKNTIYEKVNERLDYFWEYNNKDYYVGYGLDDNEFLRNLKDIYFMNDRREQWKNEENIKLKEIQDENKKNIEKK